MLSVQCTNHVASASHLTRYLLYELYDSNDKNVPNESLNGTNS